MHSLDASDPLEAEGRLSRGLVLAIKGCRTPSLKMWVIRTSPEGRSLASRAKGGLSRPKNVQCACHCAIDRLDRED
jgi:hypothetical protein